MSTGARGLDRVSIPFSPRLEPPPLSNPQAKQDDLSVILLDKKDERDTAALCVSSPLNHNTTAHEALSILWADHPHRIHSLVLYFTSLYCFKRLPSSSTSNAP